MARTHGVAIAHVFRTMIIMACEALAGPAGLVNIVGQRQRRGLWQPVNAPRFQWRSPLRVREYLSLLGCRTDVVYPLKPRGFPWEVEGGGKSLMTLRWRTLLLAIILVLPAIDTGRPLLPLSISR